MTPVNRSKMDVSIGKMDVSIGKVDDWFQVMTARGADINQVKADTDLQ